MAKINFVTKSLTTTNSVRIKLYKEPDRITVVDVLTFAAPHPQRIWTFYNIIPGVDYFFRWTEIDGAGLDIQTYASANITADANNISLRDPENIIVGVTPNVVEGTATALLNGSNGSPDFRGESIIPELIGSGFMHEGVDYSFNSTTGLFTLLNGYEFTYDVRYFIYFKPKQANNSSNVIVRDAWTSDLVVTDDITLTNADINKNIIIKGNDGYLKITLPDITAVPKGIFHFDSTDGAHKCAEIVCNPAASNSNRIFYPYPNRSSLFMGRNETISIYRDNSGTSVWRAKYPDGNYKEVGKSFYSYQEVFINAVELNGASLDSLEYARLYNDHVLTQDASNVVAFSVWGFGNNTKKYSLADPTTGLFKVPDLRNYYIRTLNAAGKPGDYLASQNLRHNHAIMTTNSDKSSIEAADPIRGRQIGSINERGREIVGGGSDGPYTIKYSGGDEARPETVKMRLFVNV